MDRWEYNSRDCIATRLLYDTLHPYLTESQERVYAAEMGLLGAFFGVQLRGLRVDTAEAKVVRAELNRELEEIDSKLSTILLRPVSRGRTKDFNPQSPDQLKTLFYDELGLRKQYKDGKLTVDESALKRIEKRAVPVDATIPGVERSRRKDVGAQVATLILQSRDLAKQKSSLSAALWDDGRIRTTLVSGGTESYRASSHKTCFGRGFNQQNVDKRLRRVYTADSGFTLVQRDLKQAESLVVAYCAGDEGYINAHLTGNTHVSVAYILFPGEPWTGDPERDKKHAKSCTIDGKEPHGRNSIYDISKMVQHGLNYLLTPDGLAKHAHMPVARAKLCYERYFAAYPGIADWHRRVIEEVYETGMLVYPGDYTRSFFGRRSDRATHREAISSIPQSVVAWTNHIVFTRIFYGFTCHDFNVLGHIHDAVLYQVRTPLLTHYESLVDTRCGVEWPVGGRTMVIPYEVKHGFRWSEV